MITELSRKSLKLRDCVQKMLLSGRTVRLYISVCMGKKEDNR